MFGNAHCWADPVARRCSVPVGRCAWRRLHQLVVFFVPGGLRRVWVALSGSQNFDGRLGDALPVTSDVSQCVVVVCGRR